MYSVQERLWRVFRCHLLLSTLTFITSALFWHNLIFFAVKLTSNRTSCCINISHSFSFGDWEWWTMECFYPWKWKDSVVMIQIRMQVQLKCMHDVTMWQQIYDITWGNLLLWKAGKWKPCAQGCFIWQDEFASTYWIFRLRMIFI